jgi:large subunit ribosomal protein L10
MAVSHQKKQEILELLNTSVSPQKAVVLITTLKAEKSLNAEFNFKVRKAAKASGITLKVVKNTLINKTFESVPNLVGPTYLAFLDEPENSDEVTTPKIMVNLVSKEFKENFNLIGSVVNGEFYNPTLTIQLSKTPSYKDSMAMLAGTLNQITAKLAIGIKEVPGGIARSIQAINQK